MPVGDSLSSEQRNRIDRAIRAAEIASRVEFSVFIGRARSAPRRFAEELHASLVAPERSVMILVDQAARALEVVTGAGVRDRLPDDVVAAATQGVTALYADGELVDGTCALVGELAQAAR